MLEKVLLKVFWREKKTKSEREEKRKHVFPILDGNIKSGNSLLRTKWKYIALHWSEHFPRGGWRDAKDTRNTQCKHPYKWSGRYGFMCWTGVGARVFVCNCIWEQHPCRFSPIRHSFISENWSTLAISWSVLFYSRCQPHKTQTRFNVHFR